MNDDYTGHMLEQILDEIKAVHELVAGQPTRAEFNELRQDVTELKQDVKVVKAAVKATNNAVADLSRDVEKHKGLPAHMAHGHA